MTTRAAVVTEPIDVAAVLREVETPSHGAAILFVGNVREVNDGKPVSGMEYTAYVAMAEKEMGAIAREAQERFSGSFVVIVHRIGELAIGDTSVAIATGHAHRDAAYQASRYVIEQLKQRVPIWKREHYTDGTREWIDPTKQTARPSPSALGVGHPASANELQAESREPMPGAKGDGRAEIFA